jgi:RNA polymerase sigma-70 factor, ECF subfamily
VQGLSDPHSDGRPGAEPSARDGEEPGEPPSFEAVYRQHFAFAWRALRCLGVPAWAMDDAAQDVWLVVHRRLPGFAGRSQLKTWLFGIALNVNRNRRRRARRHPPEQELARELVASGSDPALAREGQEAWELVSEYLETLDDVRREVFVCCLLEGLSAPETAELTGLPLNKVYNRVHALRRSFKRWLGERAENR